jgi:hypothetical protein
MRAIYDKYGGEGMSNRDIMIKLGCTRSLGRLRPRWEDIIKRHFEK